MLLDLFFLFLTMQVDNARVRFLLLTGRVSMHWIKDRHFKHY